jgi:hypothetical protein
MVSIYHTDIKFLIGAHMFFRNLKDSKDSHAVTVHTELCEALNLVKKDADCQLLEDMIENYMNNAKIKVLESYINHKIRDQVAIISKDKNNPLRDSEKNPHPSSWVKKEDLTSPDIIIKAYLKEFHLYLINNEKNTNLISDEDIKNIFGAMDPRTAHYILKTCPLISKDDKGNYDFTSYTLLNKLEVEAIKRPIPRTKEDDEKINKMLGRF